MNIALNLVQEDICPETMEAELEKDIWDVRKLGGRYLRHRSLYYLKFTEVPLVFRPLLKQFIRLQVASQSHADCNLKLQQSRSFLQYYAAHQPEARDLKDLTRSDIEGYMLHLWNTPMRDQKPPTHNHISRAMNVLKAFLEYLQRTACPQAPITSVSQLVWPEDCRAPKATPKPVKYIPDHILEQLDLHIDKLPENIRPVIIVLRASGWRIADVLNLRLGDCLEKTPSGWWLEGDIQKTQVMEHRVPISEEIANVVAIQSDRIRGLYTDEENPQKYLYPSPVRQRRGYPLTAENILKELNKMAVKGHITDEQGRLYHFRCHAFRHTKGVELINNGMNILHVQKWLAHVSPEMTLRYAQILDTTMRKEWEKAVEQGALRLSPSGQPRVVSVDELRNEDQVEWDYIRHNLDAVRLPHGYCLKPRKIECPTQAIPCYTCHHLCTTPDFLPQFIAIKQDAIRLIEAGEQQGNAQWVERNRQTLAKIEPIIQTLEQQKLHHPAGKAVREFTSKELAERNENGQQTLL